MAFNAVPLEATVPTADTMLPAAIVPQLTLVRRWAQLVPEPVSTVRVNPWVSTTDRVPAESDLTRPPMRASWMVTFLATGLPPLVVGGVARTVTPARGVGGGCRLSVGVGVLRAGVDRELAHPPAGGGHSQRRGVAGGADPAGGD